jgi:hypothetical protein
VVARRTPPRRRVVAAAMAALLFAAVTAAAQVRVVRRGDDRLKGISTLDVVVRGLDAAPSPCGLVRDELLRVAAAPLRAAGLRATTSDRDSSWYYSAIVDVTSAATDGRCATALTTTVIAHVDGIPEADRGAPPAAWGSLLIGEMPLVTERGVVQTPMAGHAGAVGDALRAQAAAIGERIRQANR